MASSVLLGVPLRHSKQLWPYSEEVDDVDDVDDVVGVVVVVDDDDDD